VSNTRAPFCTVKQVQTRHKYVAIRVYHFYCEMHFSPKRGLAIAYRLSLRLSVCDVGGL